MLIEALIILGVDPVLEQDAFSAPVPAEAATLGDKVTTDFSNIKINSDNTAQYHNEEQVWVNLTNPANLVAVWRDFRLGYRRVGVGYTFDTGWTWTDYLFEGTPYYKDSDPALTVDRHGNFYICILNFEGDYSEPNGFAVAKSSDGVNWSQVVMAVNSDGSTFEDKELIECDRTGGARDGYLYITWTRFANNMSQNYIMCVRSADGGQTWSEPVRVSSSSSCQWSVPVVGADGTLYVAWNDFYSPGIWLDKSTDGGLTFGNDRLIVRTYTANDYINGDVLVFSYPAMAADVWETSPYRGNLYIAYMDTSTAGTDYDIYFMKSEDGGVTWSQPVRVNDDPVGNGADQFHPWLFVDQEGNIHLVYYDRRDDPDNYYYNVYYTVSTDGGETWAPSRRVTSESSAPVEKGGVLGEYFGLTAWNGKPFIVWTDTREGHQRVYFGTDTTYSEVKGGGGEGGALFTVLYGSLVPKVKALCPGTLEAYDASGRLALRRELEEGQVLPLALERGVYQLRFTSRRGTQGITVTVN